MQNHVVGILVCICQPLHMLVRRITPIPKTAQQTNTLTIKTSQSAKDFPACKDEVFIYHGKQHLSLCWYSGRRGPSSNTHLYLAWVVWTVSLCSKESFGIALESRVIVEPQAQVVVCPLSVSMMHTTISLILIFSSSLASIFLCP